MIQGRVFYDDFRTRGRFAIREDESGVDGTQVDFTGSGHNYLGALDATVSVLELDAFDNPNFNCTPSVVVGSTHVAADGSFSVAIFENDPCLLEGPAPNIAVIVSLGYYDAKRHFSVVEDLDGADEGLGDVLSLEYAAASTNNPHTLSTPLLDLGTMYFQEVDYDDLAKGASVFAAAVDVTRKFNVEAQIERVSNDEIVLEYPDNVANAATNGTVIHIPAPAVGSWIHGNGALHEYGHAMHFVTWSGTTGTCSTNTSPKYLRDGVSGWSACSREWPTTAFSEGFANFVSRATLDRLPGGCSTAGFDDNRDPADATSVGSPVCNADAGEFPDASVAVTYGNDGEAYARNVTKTLCDFLDVTNEDDLNLAGGGDHFGASLPSIGETLAGMYNPGASPDCLDICDFVDQYLNVTSSAAVLGQQLHESFVAGTTDLVYQNALECGLPTP